MAVYIEKISFFLFLKLIFFRKQYKKIYYFDTTKPLNFFFILFRSDNLLNIFLLQFKLIDVKDKSGELVRLRIHRKDLFDFEDEVKREPSYNIINELTKNNVYLKRFIDKGIMDGSVNEINSVSRALFVINVVSFHSNKKGHQKPLLILNKRSWFRVYERYAKKYNISLIFKSNISLFNISYFKNILKNNYLLRLKIDNYINNRTNTNYNSINEPILYLQGRGDINLKNNGMHSDFFWLLNSDFPCRNVMISSNSDSEKKMLDTKNIKYDDLKLKIIKSSKEKLKKIKNYSNSEIFSINRLVRENRQLNNYWNSFIKTYNIKLFFSWYKYTRHHVAINESIFNNGGILAMWQMAFDGNNFHENKTTSDIVFSFSNFSTNLDEKIGSKIKYNIISGYPTDYSIFILKKKKSIIRKKLIENGAKKIIFSIDENSIDDNRWHTGHELQRENYSYLCEKILEVPWLGIVFKPKNAKDLRQRLGPVNELLRAAEKTGRCHIFEDIGRHTTLASPIYAGLISDVCIHGHLSSGTSALECALAGIPTLLIDREGSPKNKLNDLPKNLIVFRDWKSAIEMTIDYFNNKNKPERFGDWSSYLNEFDPFRDGKAANRIGNYLNWILEGFKNGKSRDIILEEAANRYANLWGEDKVVRG